MTQRKLIVAGFAVALAAAMAACDNGNLTNLNQDPNNPSDAPAGSLFTQGVSSATGRLLGSGLDLRGTEFLAQHLTEVQYPDEDRFTRLTGGSTAGYFNSAYANELEDFKQVMVRGKRQNDAGIWAPASIMSSWVFENLTDIWGDIPYSQALKGDSGILSPTYDKQQDIYAALFARLDSASKALQGTGGSLGSADPIFGGDPVKWQRFANSLRARLAMRIVNVDPATARTQFQAAVNAPGGLMTSNADNAELAWPGDGIYNNPWSDNFLTRDDHRLSDRLVGVMQSLSDPRLAVYGQPTQASGGYAGAPNGLTADKEAAYLNTASRPGAIFYPGQTAYGFFGGNGPRQPSYLMTYAETELLLAEAAERGWTVPGSAASHYAAGVTASMQQWGVSNTGTINAYLATPSVAYKGGPAGLAQIAVQKWIALFTDGTQAWAEWRRTCQPTVVHAGADAIQSTMPRRLQYSTTEVSVNSTNLQAAIARQGADKFTTRIWWDTAPQNAPTFVDAATCSGPQG